MRWVKSVIFFLLSSVQSLLLQSNTFSQVQKYNFDHLSIDNRLSENTINDIYKDSKGYIWLATNNGLNKYDGYGFKIFKNAQNDTSSISGNTIKTILEDKNHDLWICTRTEGVSRYNRIFNNFTQFHSNPTVKGNLSSNFTYSGLIDSLDNIWIGTIGGGLNLYDKNNNNFIHFLKDSTNPHAIHSDSIFSIFELRKGYLLITTNTGLEYFDINKRIFKHFPYRISNRPYNTDINYRKIIFRDSKNNIWITDYGLLYRLDVKTFKAYPYYIKDLESPDITDICEDKQGNFWIGTDGAGMVILNPETGEVSKCKYVQDNDKSLSSNAIYRIYKDNTGIMWVGTFAGGLNIYDQYRYKFKVYKGKNNNPYSLSYKTVLDIIPSGNGGLWIGTDGGGLNYFDRRSEVFTHYFNKPNTPAVIKDAKVIVSICLDSKGLLWLGTYNQGLIVYDVKKNKAKAFLNNPADPNTISSNNIWAVYEDKQKRIWIGTLGCGVDLYIPESNSFKHFKNLDSGLNPARSNYINFFFEDSKDRFWVATAGQGVYIMDRVNGICTNYQNNPKDSFSISNNFVQAMDEDNEGKIWFGTASGLNFFDDRKGRFTRIWEAIEDKEDNIMGLLCDGHNNIWYSTVHGLVKFNPHANTYKLFDVIDGLQSNEFSLNACLKLKDGTFVFGGINGFNIFHPDSVKNNPHPPTIVFTDFKVFNQSVIPGTPGALFKYNINIIREVTLKESQSVLTIEFAALNFTAPEKNRYQYMLEGFDQNWVNAGNTRSATYTNLNPGEYNFKVIASNNDGVWNYKGANFKIIIKPPFWKTWYFRILTLVLIITSILFYIHLRTRRINRQKLLLENTVKEKTEDIRQYMKVLEAQQEKILAQKSEIERQNDKLVTQSLQIKLKNQELEIYSIVLEQRVKDRTEALEKALRKAEESDKLKSAFLANMSHEIRTPMNSILGFSRLLSSPDFAPDEKLQFIEHINKNCDSLLNLIDDIIDLSKIEAGQLKITNRQVEVNSLLLGLYNLYVQEKRLFEREILEMKLNIPQDTVIIATDPMRVEQIIRNLLNNAFKFTDEGYIELGCKIRSELLEIYVKDTGMGIPTDKHQLVFDPFVKVEDDKDRLFRGAGLGLSICKRLATMMGGDINLESEVGKGSRFWFTLPIK